MKLSILFVWLLAIMFVGQATAQESQKLDLEATITDVTVYMEGALIMRRGELQVPTGKSVIKLSSLSPYIDKQSLNVEVIGDVTVLAVKHSQNYLDNLAQKRETDSLLAEGNRLNDEIAVAESRKSVLNGLKSMLSSNVKDLKGDKNLTIQELTAAVEFYETRLMAINKEHRELNAEIAQAKEHIKKLNAELRGSAPLQREPMGEIEVEVFAEQAGNLDLNISYLVENAGWFPKYDIRVKSIGEPLMLSFQANLFQNTGVDWNDVKLKFSNGQPSKTSTAPELEPLRLGYSRPQIKRSNAIRDVAGIITDADTGEPLPGANVLVADATIGTYADVDGRYALSLPKGQNWIKVSYIGYVDQTIHVNSSIINIALNADIAGLDEVVVTAVGNSGYFTEESSGRDWRDESEEEFEDVSRLLAGKVAGVNVSAASGLQTTYVQQANTVEFVVQEPYSLATGGDAIDVELSRSRVPADYQYISVPKLEKQAYLIAKIPDWAKLSLLTGQANLYFEDGYIGRTILDAEATRDTLEEALGPDRSITVNREKVDEFSKSRIVGRNKTETRGFEIQVRNNKNQPITITILDQIPLSSLDAISVSPTELDGGEYDKEDGEVKWVLTIPAGQSRKLDLGYKVKSPKSRKVYLE